MEEKKKPKPFGYIYDIVCCLNDQEYIGQTIQTVEARFSQHCKYHDTHIDNAIFSYGRENFLVFTLRECYSQAELDKWERWIIFAKGTKEPFGYNVADGGKSLGDQSGKKNHAYGKASPFQKSVYPNLLAELAKHGINTYRQIGELLGLSTDSIKQKMHGKLFFTDEQQAFLADYLGKPIEYLFARSDGKSSVSNYHKTPSDETKQKIRESTSGEKNHFFGKQHTDETIQKISETQRAYCPYKNLLAAMDEIGIVSYAALAERMEISLPNISRKMSGKVPFTDEDKVKLVAIFNKPIDYLLEREDRKPVESSSRHKTPLQNLLARMKEKGYKTYTAFAVPMQMNLKNLADKMSGKSSFTPEQQARLVEVLDAPIEYLLARVDE